MEYRETKGNRRGYHIYNDDLSYQKEAGTDFEAIAEGWCLDHPAPLRPDVARGPGRAARLGGVAGRVEEGLMAALPSAGAGRGAAGRRAPLYKAVVFDLDGTVVDSVELIIVSFQHAIREVLGRELSREDAIAWVGMPLREQMERFSPRARGRSWWRSTGSSTTASTTACSRSTTASSTCWHGLREAGVKVGLVTSKSRFTTQMAFDLTGIEVYFDATVCADEASGNKPSPDPILACLEQLGVEPVGGCVRGRQPVGHPGGPRGGRGRHSGDLGCLPRRETGG